MTTDQQRKTLGEAVTIRPASASDVPVLSELAKRTWADAFGDSVATDDVEAELEDTRSETYFVKALGEKTILVAELAGRLVGYVQFGDVSIAEADLRPGDQELQRLYVNTDLQGNGLGRALMNAALAHPRLVDAPRIYLQVWERNLRAVRLYRSLGFETVATTRFTIGAGEVVEDVVMLLDKSKTRAAR